MTDIRNQILAEVGSVIMQSKTITDPEFYKNPLKLLLTTKQTKYILPDPEERDRLYNWTPPVLFPEYHAFFHHNHDHGDEVHEEDMPQGDYSAVMDGFGISELFCDSRRWVITPDYLKHVRMYKDTKGFLVNIYGVENHLIDKDMWNFSDCEPAVMEFNKGDIPECPLAQPDTILHTYVGKPTYWDEMYIECCKDNIVALLIDLPHEYYSGQMLKGNIYTWDLAKKEYFVGGKSMSEINEMILAMSATGIQEPLVMRINEGCLTPIDNETNIKLFLATYLRLPTIPVVLYMSNEECMFNGYLEELHNIVHSDYWHSPHALNYVNSILMPYFFFELADRASESAYLRSGDTVVHKNRYPIMNTIGDDDHIHVYDRYFDTKTPVEEIHLPMTDEQSKFMIANRNNELMDDLRKRLKEEEEEVLHRIMNGDY